MLSSLWFLSVFGFYVYHQVAAVSVDLRADITRVTLGVTDAVDDGQVRDERVLLREALQADLALIGSEPDVTVLRCR